MRKQRSSFSASVLESERQADVSTPAPVPQDDSAWRQQPIDVPVAVSKKPDEVCMMPSTQLSQQVIKPCSLHRLSSVVKVWRRLSVAASLPHSHHEPADGTTR